MIKIDDFKVGGSQRKYITHTGVLPEVDGTTLSDEQKTTLLGKCYTMCDGYIAQPAEGESTGDETGKTTGETTGEGTGESTQENTQENTQETGKAEEENPQETEEKSQDGGVSTLK